MTAQRQWTPDGAALVFSANRRDDRRVRAAGTRDLRSAAGGRRREGAHEPARPRRRSRRLARRQAHRVHRLRRPAPGLPGDAALHHEPRRQRLEARAGCARPRRRRTPSGAETGKGSILQYHRPGEHEGRLHHARRAGDDDRRRRSAGATSAGPTAADRSPCRTRGRVAFTQTHARSSRPTSPWPPRDRRRSGSRASTTISSARRRSAPWRRSGSRSSFDKRKIQGWIVKPPGFDAKKKYPLMLEIHGGPFANYGAALRDRDAALRGGGLRRALHQSARQHQLRRGVRQPHPPRLSRATTTTT